MHIRTSHSLAGCLAAAALIVSVAAQAGPNIVVNGGFETGDFSGWTASIDPVFDGVDSFAPHSGTFAAFFGNPSGASTISQTLTTVSGTVYCSRLLAASRSGRVGASAPNAFSFDWNGGAAELALTDSPAFGYTHYHFLLQATAATTQLAFTFANEPAFWDFDDASVAAPEPGSAALVALACGLLALTLRRRRS